MLTKIYIKALLVDENLADQIWEAWNKGEIVDQVAWFAWQSTKAGRLLPGLAARIILSCAH